MAGFATRDTAKSGRVDVLKIKQVLQENKNKSITLAMAKIMTIPMATAVIIAITKTKSIWLQGNFF